MLRPAVTLDAAMSVAQALTRLARHGFWLDPDSPDAAAWLDDYVTNLRQAAKEAGPRDPQSPVPISTETSLPRFRRPDPMAMTRAQAAALLASPVQEGRVVIRRQDGITVFWYARSVDEVLHRLSRSARDEPVLFALDLHEYTSDPAEQVNALDGAEAEHYIGVVLNGTEVFGVGEQSDVRAAAVDQGAVRGGMDTGAEIGMEPRSAGTPAPANELHTYPYLDAPPVVIVDQWFTFEVGLSDVAIAGVFITAPLVVPVPDAADEIDIDVQVVADGFVAPNGWRGTMRVNPRAPGNPRVQFTLMAQQQNVPVRLTSLGVHYSVGGVACGNAYRNIVVGRTAADVPPPDDRGQSWLDAEPPSSGVVLSAAAARPDVELNIAKPDGNAASGDYRCFFSNSHGVPVTDDSHAIHLGEDSETFAKKLIDEMRLWSGDAQPIVNRLLEGMGQIIADKLPQEFWVMLSAVAATVKDRPLTLQLNTAEPYVPWELALVDPPLDPARPPFLGAQVAMGRWILGDAHIAVPPKASISVKAMAVMAGMYNVNSGLQPLPMAQAEASQLAQTYAALPAVPLDCTAANLELLLEAELTLNFQPVGGAQLVHFAGHGEVDPTRPGDAALFLSNGRPLSPFILRKSRLGKEHAPFMFLNACMVGTGGKMLGDFGGFPGNCLAGGFTGLIAPLWAVNDSIAKSFAIDFYQQVMAGAGGRPVAEVLRDLRGKYQRKAPIPSYLAYVFYGNPALTVAA